MRQGQDRFADFAAAHLRTAAQRVVYAVLAGDPAASMSASELATQSHFDEYEFDVILRQFTAAGIVTQAEADGPDARYRWHSGTMG